MKITKILKKMEREMRKRERKIKKAETELDRLLAEAMEISEKGFAKVKEEVKA